MSLRVFLSTISAYCNKIDKYTLFSHPLAERFLRGLLHIHPHIKTCAETWDLPLVLQCLTRCPFELVETCDLRLLSWKTAFLVAVTSVHRVSELAALEIRPPYMTFLPHAVKLSTNNTFLPKIVSEYHLHQGIVLPDFYPEPEDSSERLLHSLDVTRATKFYLYKTKHPGKNSNLFVSYAATTSLGCKVSSEHLFHWVVELN